MTLSASSLLNTAIVWLYAHVGTAVGGSPYLLAAIVAAAGWLAVRVGGRVIGWLFTAAVTAITLALVLRLVGLGV